MLLGRDKLGLHLSDLTCLAHEQKGLDSYVSTTLSNVSEILNQIVYHVADEDRIRPQEVWSHFE